MHAEFSSRLINYAVLTLASVSFSLCKHEAAQSGKRVGRAGCQAPAEMRVQCFECWMVFMLRYSWLPQHLSPALRPF